MTDEYDVDPDATKAATEMAWRILVQETAKESGRSEDTVDEVLDGLSTVLARFKPQETFGLCGNIVQRGHDQ